MIVMGHAEEAWSVLRSGIEKACIATALFYRHSHRRSLLERGGPISQKQEQQQQSQRVMESSNLGTCTGKIFIGTLQSTRQVPFRRATLRVLSKCSQASGGAPHRAGRMLECSLLFPACAKKTSTRTSVLASIGQSMLSNKNRRRARRASASHTYIHDRSCSAGD